MNLESIRRRLRGAQRDPELLISVVQDLVEEVHLANLDLRTDLRDHRARIDRLEARVDHYAQIIRQQAAQ